MAEPTGMAQWTPIADGSLVTKLSMKLSSGSEDSTAELMAYDPSCAKYLDSAARYELPVKLAGREFKFLGQVSNLDLATQIVTLTGNSPAWEYNQETHYRLFQQKTPQQILTRLGVKVEGQLPSEPLDFIQNYVTDYQAAQRLCAGLGLRLAGDLEGSGKVKATKDSGDVVLGIEAKSDGRKLEYTTSEGNSVFVTGLSLSQEDTQDTAKTEPSETPETATEDSDSQTQPSEKYVRINPQTGQREVANQTTTPATEQAKAKAKAKALKLTIGLVVSAQSRLLVQPGDSVSLVYTDASGSNSQSDWLVESVSYEFYPEHFTLEIEGKTSEKSR